MLLNTGRPHTLPLPSQAGFALLLRMVREIDGLARDAEPVSQLLVR